MDKTTETTPDELMEDFRGRSLKSIILFTIAIHAIVLLASSVPFLLKKFGVTGGEELSESQRAELAMKEATETLQKIAKEYDLRPQQLSDQFAAGSKTGTSVKTPTETARPDGTSDPNDSAGEPKSSIEKELEVSEPGPTVPPVVEDEDEDLFK